MSDMTALLNDLSYIPPNNEHNEPTQGEIGETSNEPTQATLNEFEELYASANEELYPGCDHVTRLDFMAKFTYFKVKGKLTDSIFNGPSQTPISVNSCVVNGVRFVVHSRDEHRITQNSGICSPGRKDVEMYYGQLQEILEFLYLSFKVVLFRVKWFDTSNEGRKVKHLVLRNNMTQIDTRGEAFKDDQYILVT
ncbi:hypothetical protein Tco_0192532, partial [Tanacetum coccineum]